MGYERTMSARQKALELNKRKDAIEAEMEAIVSALTVRRFSYYRFSHELGNIAMT